MNTENKSSWNSFVSSSFIVTDNNKQQQKQQQQHERHHSLTSGGSLFGLQQALSTTSPNTSGVLAGGSSSSSPSPSSKLPSFFIAKKGDLQLNNNTQQQQQQHQGNLLPVSTSTLKMRDVALKHLFQPELVSAAVSAATTMSSFLMKSSEVSAISSSGVTPLKTAPLRLGVRKRLGLALLNQKSKNFGVDDKNEEEEEYQEASSSSPPSTEVLRYVGNRVLLMKSDQENPFPHQKQQKSSKSPDTTTNSALPPRKSSQNNQITSSSTIEGVPTSSSHYQQQNHENENEEQALQRHIEEAASRAKSLSYAQLYEESVQRESRMNKEKEIVMSPQEKLRLLQQEQEELEKQKMYDGQAFEITASSSAAQKNVIKKQPSTPSGRVSGNKKPLDVPSSSSSPVPPPQQNPQPTRQVDRTGDFKTPLTAARHHLQNAYQNLEQDHGIPASQVSHLSKFQNNKNATTRNLASTVTYLQGKFDCLSQVANKIEQEEHKMRLATATILAEILALKQLEDAAKSEAMSWIEYAEDFEEETSTSNNTNPNISNLSLKRDQVFEASTAARDLLIDLE